MRILVEPSEYRFLNAGDAAMTQITIERLCALWPSAKIRVLTDLPERLPRYGAQVLPLSTRGRVIWRRERQLSKQNRYLRVAAAARHWCSGNRQKNQRAVAEFLKTVSSADLFVVSGMGGLTSAFPEYARMLLDSIELAAAHGVRIVLFGQGIGPLDDELTSRARQVLPKVEFIGLREGCFGPPLLRSFQVPDDRIFVTGDDAIEIAFRRRRDDLQRAIGINVRTANYSGVDPDFLPRLRGPVLSAAQALGAPLVPVPISALGGEEDMNAIASLLGSSNSAVAVDQSTGIHLQAIERIQQCRMVITGSYHAGVFALAQGISVVGLAANAYYLWKFRGLAHQFGEGCAVVALNEPGAFDLLQRLIESTWSGAERLRPALLAAAERQVGQSRAAYQRVYERIAHDGQRSK